MVFICVVVGVEMTVDLISKRLCRGSESMDIFSPSSGGVQVRSVWPATLEMSSG